MKRREFLQAGAGAGFLLASGRLFGAGAPSNRVRLAVMGCHARGRGFQVMKTAAGLPGVEIAAVCDVDARARDAAAAEILRRTGRAPAKEGDLRRVLEDRTIDGVICAAPDHWHAPAAWMAMNAGKAIYVEKPCSHNAREGEILVETARRTGQVFQMGNQRRSSAVYREAVRAIRGGAIGEPRFARCWYRTRRAPIGKGRESAPPEWLDWDLWQGPAPRRAFQNNVVHYKWHWFKLWGTGECGNNAVHFTDVGRWALGALFPERVTCSGARLFHAGDDWEWYDTQNATFEFPGRRVMTWEGLSSVTGQPYGGHSSGCIVYGLKGSVLFAPDNVCTQFDAAGKKVREWNARDVAADPDNRTNPSGGLDRAHLADFAACIRAKSQATASPAPEAHASTLLAHLANIAAAAGETVRVDPATGALRSPKACLALWSRSYEPGWEMK